MIAKRAMTNHWFVSVEMPKLPRGTQTFSRLTKTFPTEAAARQYAKEVISNKNRIIAGTLLGVHQTVRRIISGSELYRWIEQGDPP
jgi:hypothetical protein